MFVKHRLYCVLLALLSYSSYTYAIDGTYHSVNYEPTGREGGLQIGVTHTLWIPDSAKTIRGIIIHQHGCGVGACKSGETAAYDIHWQALAAKWNCALLGPSYRQAAEQSCRLWCDPRNGSSDVLINSLKKLAQDSGHEEIVTAPWCLWGHSGGGFWASLLQMQYPERIVSIWFQSGTAYGYWKKGEIESPVIPRAAMQIPMMANPGLKEKDHERFHVAWDYSLAMFNDYRSQGAPIAFTPDPVTGHDTGDSRYLAIPFFDTTLAMRLPETQGAPLKKVDQSKAFLATLLSSDPVAMDKYSGDPLKACWLPDAAFASKWSEFVTTGAVKDTTPPPTVNSVSAKPTESGIVITWKADADLESGIRQFVVFRNNDELGRVPANLPKKPYRNLFQGKTYGDTPVAGYPKLEFTDKTGKPTDSYRIISINSAGLESK